MTKGPRWIFVGFSIQLFYHASLTKQIFVYALRPWVFDQTRAELSHLWLYLMFARYLQKYVIAKSARCRTKLWRQVIADLCSDSRKVILLVQFAPPKVMVKSLNFPMFHLDFSAGKCKVTAEPLDTATRNLRINCGKSSGATLVCSQITLI